MRFSKYMAPSSRVTPKSGRLENYIRTAGTHIPTIIIPDAMIFLRLLFFSLGCY